MQTEPASQPPRQAIAHEGTKLLVAGISGTGKTTFALRYMLGLTTARTFIYDHEGEIWQRLGVRPALTFNELKQSIEDNRLVIFDSSVEFPGDKMGGWNYFCDLVFNLCQTFNGRKLIVADELQKLCDTDNLSDEFASVLETGRRAELDLLAITRAPNLLHNRIRNELTECVVFRLQDPRATDYLKILGFDPVALRGLARGQFIARDLFQSTETIGRVF